MPSLSVASQKRLFANLEDVVRLHRSFLRDLTLLMEEPNPRFEPLFRKYVREGPRDLLREKRADEGEEQERYARQHMWRGRDSRFVRCGEVLLELVAM